MPKDRDLQLLNRLLEAACIGADERLSAHAGDVSNLEVAISDLELSPLVDKQLIAVALRLATEPCPTDCARRSLLARFNTVAPTAAIEAQRRAVQKDIEKRGLPMELARNYAATLERRAQVPAHDLPDRLWVYALIYDDLWCDPRIGAPSTTRRIMLAMATTLRARSAELIAAKHPERAAPTITTNYGRESVVPPEPIGGP